MMGQIKQRMRRRLAVFIISIVLLLAAAFALYKFFLPNYLADRIVQALQERGLAGVALEVSEISFSHARLKNFRIGEHNGLFIREIRVGFSQESLARNRVHVIRLHGAHLPLAIVNGKIDWGPLANYSATGPFVLPFDSLTIAPAALRLEWEGRHFQIPLTAEIQNRHNDSLAMALHARHENSQIELRARCTLDSLHGLFDLKLANFEAGLWQHAQKNYFPGLTFRSSGKLDAAAQIIYEGRKWRAYTAINGDSLQVEYSFRPSGYQVKVAPTQADLEIKSDSLSFIKARGFVNGAPIAIEAAANLKTLAGSGELSIADLQASAIEKMVETFATARPVEFSGALSARGSYDFDGKNIAARLTLDGKKFSLRAAAFSHKLQASPQKIEIDANLLFKKEPAISLSKRLPQSPRLQLLDFKARVQGLNIFDEKLGLALDSVAAVFPVDWQKQEMHGGEFSMARMHWHDQQLPPATGTLAWVNGSWRFSAAAQLFSQAHAKLSGNLTSSASEILINVPSFRLENSAALAPFFPALEKAKITGSFEISGKLKVEKDRATPYLRLEAPASTWASKLSSAKIEAIAGVLELDGVQPFTSAGLQRFTFGRAAFGSFELTGGEMIFRLTGADSIWIESLTGHWAGGRLASEKFWLRPAAARVEFKLEAEALDLQAILDFIEYEGIKGQGKIYGHIPIVLQWGEKKRLSFGEGFLEARPHKGVLQLSKENAMAIMGIKKDIDLKGAGLEETVSLMVINALQDMEYTNLRFDFKNEPGKGWMTYVQAQGRGPRHDPENGIPIGGFKVNINHLDDLLNSMIWSNMGRDAIKMK